MTKIIQYCCKWLFQKLKVVAKLTADNIALRHQLAVLNNHMKDMVTVDFLVVPTIRFKVLTSFRSPWQNAFVERLNGSIRRECTD